jgi:hypothetical protein
VYTSLLWQTFSALTPLERKHLGQWLRSPFFCRREQPGKLYGYLQDCLEKGRQPDPEQAASEVLKDRAGASSAAWRLVMAELLGHIEHFLVYREKFDAAPDFKTHLAAAYRKRGLEKHFRQSLQEARATWERQPYRHTEYFDAQVAIEYELYQHLSSDRRTEALNLQELSDNTDLAYIARKLRQVCFALTHQAVYKADYSFGLLEPLLEFVRRMPALSGVPVVSLYFHCYRFLTEPEPEESFTRFKELLLAHAGELPEEELRNLHLLAINYCVKKINRSEARFFREALDLYQSALRGRLLLENGILSPFAFNNIVAIALKVQETAWVEGFIEEYAPFLEKKQREAIVHLNRARLAYSRRQYRDVLLHLQGADYKDLINNLIAKTLQLKTYYETDELDALDAHLQSMQTFLRRQRVIGYHRTNYQNIIRFTRRLMQHNPNDRSEREALRRQIETEEVLTEKEWLVEMCGNR